MFFVKYKEYSTRIIPYMSKFVQISKSKYRTVVCDILPYERPLFFSNRFFARFLKRYGISIKDGRLTSLTISDNKELDSLLLLLGGAKDDDRKCFQYDISKDGLEKGRRLTVIHPFHQVQMIEFYDKYKTLLIDFCSRSNFSIRFPYKIATYQNDQEGFSQMLSDIDERIDTRESIKHFFAYKHYHNINYFYDDYRFIRAEKRFSCMLKVDLKDCFESIEPKSLSIAMFDMDMISCQGTLADDFCNLQQSFLSEHDGIVIGPEFSRIYAEIILQKIDVLLESSLSKKFQLENTKDYLFYRYVDDGFLFCKDSKIARFILNEYISILELYQLRINEKKVKLFDQRPFLEPITFIKHNLMVLIDSVFENRLETFKGFKKIQNNCYDTPTLIDFKSFVKSVRSIMASGGIDQSSDVKQKSDLNVHYKDIMSYLLGLMQKRLDALLKEFHDLYKQYREAEYKEIISEEGLEIKNKYENDFLDFTLNLVEICFYLLSCDLRMATSIKIVSLVNKLQLFVRGHYKFDDGTLSKKFSHIYITILDKRISEETQNLLDCNISNSYNTMEILNVLELQKIMSVQCQISEDSLMRFMNPQGYKKELNFFIVFELIHFINYSSNYEWLKSILYEWINSTLMRLLSPGESDTEAVLTAFELFCCPWTNEGLKQKWAIKLFGNQSAKVLQFASKQKDLFIRWHDYHVNEELQHVIGAEVY